MRLGEGWQYYILPKNAKDLELNVNYSTSKKFGIMHLGYINSILVEKDLVFVARYENEDYNPVLHSTKVYNLAIEGWEIAQDDITNILSALPFFVEENPKRELL